MPSRRHQVAWTLCLCGAVLGTWAATPPVSAQESSAGDAPQSVSSQASETESSLQTASVPSSGGSQNLYGRLDAFMPVRLDGHVALTWEGHLGVGGRVDIPLVSGTFRYSGRDELALSVGGDVTFLSFSGSRLVEVFPTLTLQWSLSVTERAFFFPELGLVGHVDDGRWDGLKPNIGFGARYYVHRSLSLQGRMGWPVGLAAGVTF
jgi:hypothetical protein